MALVTRAARGLLRRRAPLACLQQDRLKSQAVAYEEDDEDYAPEITSLEQDQKHRNRTGNRSPTAPSPTTRR